MFLSPLCNATYNFIREYQFHPHLLLDYIAEETGFVDDIKSWASQYENEIKGILFYLVEEFC